MSASLRQAIAGLVLLVSAVPAGAAEWKHELAPYVWGSAMDGTVGVGDEFKIVNGGWGTNYGAGYWITSYDQTWTFGKDGANAQIQGAPNTFVTLVSTTNPTDSPTSFGTTDEREPALTQIRTVRPRRTRSPAAGSWVAIRPGGTVSLNG